MFDIGWGELVVIGIVALVVIGPKELPTVMRTMGQWMTKIRRMASEFQGQFQEAMRESELADLKKQIDSLKDTTNNLTDFNPVETARKEIEGALEDKPKAAAEPEPAMADASSAATETMPSSAGEGSVTSEPAAASPTATASETVELSSFDVPPPDPLPPLTEKDFASDTPHPPAPPPGGRVA